MRTNKEVIFLGETCSIHKEQYENGRLAIILFVDEAGEMMCTASVNLPDIIMADNEVAIKDYSENEGVLEVLIKAGIISKPDRIVNSGHVKIPICRLLI